MSHDPMLTPRHLDTSTPLRAPAHWPLWLLIVLFAIVAWASGRTPQGCTADLNGDGGTDGRDLCVLLSQFGNVGDDPVALGHCPRYDLVEAYLAGAEFAFRQSVADVPSAAGAPYPTGFIVGDFNRNGTIDGQDLSVLLGEFGCGFTTEDAESRGGQP